MTHLVKRLIPALMLSAVVLVSVSFSGCGASNNGVGNVPAEKPATKQDNVDAAKKLEMMKGGYNSKGAPGMPGGS